MARNRSLGSTPLWIIVVLGGALTALGVLIQIMGKSPLEQTAAATLAALGGGVLGAGISLYMASGDGRDTLTDVRKLLTSSLEARMRSDDDELTIVRREWHFYHLTQYEGRYRWRYTDYKLDASSVANTTVCMVRDNAFGREHVFRAEVAVRGDRVILVEEDVEGSVPGLVAITPDFAGAYRKVRAGVALVHSWDGTSILSKCLWSVDPLTTADPIEGEVGEEDAVALERVWKQTFCTSNMLLPSVTDTIDYGD